MSWDHAMLDALLGEWQEQFYAHLREDEGLPEAEQSHQVTGYFMLRLAACKPGAELNPPPPATITGPLFSEPTERMTA